MPSILDSVDQRTQLVGENRLELLMFRLQRGSLFALNVFKIQEVQTLPKLTNLPQSHPHIVGVTYARDRTIPVIDLSAAIGMGQLTERENCNIIITEYNRSVQAFLVKSVDRIVNMNWEEIMPPPKGAGRAHYLTAITKYDDQLVEIIDVEKVLQEVSPFNTQVNPEILDSGVISRSTGLEVLAVDDSSVGLAQVRETIKQLGLTLISASDGAMALRMLKQWADEGIDVHRKLTMVITDAEMPEMDGYRLTREIRSDPRLKDLYVILHTSLSGSFNKAMVEKVGCNDFLSKFEPDKLAMAAQQRVREYCDLYSIS
ncbi:chemotaxis protein CheV [Ketobacter sp. MCCC 1A13808]|uniref:chemotaxis protein CheV n=1 Tax=Ketobacter sp. MCCC 1A13808 TaxID=2602738 RepID=UPI000F2400C5|nr:chemotaxis protein CheV [Ketobacter sp. MCCC 1A13808]MVF14432.1 chemotaxis protein CheV [Ketobacter sp. MCCC 1A13808]RLP52776.1 MAG: chemotaxis signal transduction protein CheV [Ketobacter sp.]